MSLTPPRLSSLPIVSTTQAKIRLYWFCRHHFSLSPNIIREICLFLSHSVSILHHSQGHPYLYHIPSNTRIAVDIPSYYRDFGEIQETRAVCIGDYKVVACGGIRDSYACAQAYLVNAGQLCRLEDMQRRRAFHAVLYYDFAHSIYAFGGAEGLYDKLATCEKFDIATMRWKAIGDMTSGKSNICACQYLTSVYILGDSTWRIEVFSLATEEFRVLQKVISPVDVRFAAAVGDGLVVLTDSTVQRIRLPDWKITYIWQENYSQSFAGLQHTTLYILHSDCIALFHCLACDSPQSLPDQS